MDDVDQVTAVEQPAFSRSCGGLVLLEPRDRLDVDGQDQTELLLDLAALGRRLAAEQPEFPLNTWASAAEPDDRDMETRTGDARVTYPPPAIGAR
ncbi:hypothetical protein ACI1MP_37375 (plasmid) [Kitasatospora griseola]|uniref:hypothetical protein n=1 Tax=Kitasatospora griseola TaxID=2064 RepID=UPI003855822B